MLGVTNAIINNALNNILHAIWFYMLTQKPKHSKLTTAMLAALSVVIAEVLSLFTIFNYGVEGPAFTILYLIGTLVYVFFFVFLMNGEKKLKSLFIFFSYICVWATVYVISMVLYTYVFQSWEPSIWILRTIFNVILFVLYHYFFKTKIVRNGVAIEQASRALLLVSGMAYLLLPTLMIIYAFGERSLFILLCTAFLIAFAVAVYTLIFRFIGQVAREQQMQELELHNKYLLQRAENFEALEREVQKDRHDYKHHNAMLLQYAQNGDIKSMMDFLVGFDAREEEKYIQLCNNKIIDNILRSFLRKSENCKIVMNMDTKIDSQTNIKDVDMVAILGNMLENAVNACMASPEPRLIDVSIVKKGIKVVLEVKNTATGNIRFENGIPKRVKGGGVGVQSILYYADQYQGDVVFNYENGVFTCCVILNDISPKN